MIFTETRSMIPHINNARNVLSQNSPGRSWILSIGGGNLSWLKSGSPCRTISVTFVSVCFRFYDHLFTEPTGSPCQHWWWLNSDRPNLCGGVQNLYHRERGRERGVHTKWPYTQTETVRVSPVHSYDVVVFRNLPIVPYDCAL